LDSLSQNLTIYPRFKKFDFKIISLSRLDKNSIEGMLDYEGLLYVEELATAEDSSIKNKLWNLFEAPESGNCARLVSLISVMVSIGQILAFG